MRFTAGVDRRTLQRRLVALLFRFETTLPFGLCSFDAATYRGAPGKGGLPRYRELAEAEWRKLKPRDANDGRIDENGESVTAIRRLPGGVARAVKAEAQFHQVAGRGRALGRRREVSLLEFMSSEH
jgi:hypothetical protein